MKLRRTFIINLAILAAMLALSAWAWVQLPADSQIAMHFDAAGMPDRYTGKRGLLELPLVAFITSVMFVVIPRIDPLQQNIQQSQKAYTTFSVATMFAIAAIHTTIILFALGQPVNIISITNIVLGLLFIVVGNYSGKIRRNYFFGCRTPWTLSSERAWHKTHRLGGWLLLPHGVALLVAGVINVSLSVTYALLISLVVSLVLVLPVYSYQVWKIDPERLTH